MEYAKHALFCEVVTRAPLLGVDKPATDSILQK